MDAYTVYFNKSIYEATEEEIIELENHSNSLFSKEATDYIRPIFEDIQIEKSEVKEFVGDLIIRLGEKKDFEGLIRFSRRVNLTGDKTGIRSYSIEDLNVTMSGGVMFLATTLSGYIVGVSSILIAESNGNKFGHEFTIMVSKLFRRKKVAENLFYKLIEHSRNIDLTDISTKSLSVEGLQFFDAMKQKRQDLEFGINRYGGTSSIILKR